MRNSKIGSYILLIVFSFNLSCNKPKEINKNEDIFHKSKRTKLNNKIQIHNTGNTIPKSIDNSKNDINTINLQSKDAIQIVQKNDREDKNQLEEYNEKKEPGSILKKNDIDNQNNFMLEEKSKKDNNDKNPSIQNLNSLTSKELHKNNNGIKKEKHKCKDLKQKKHYDFLGNKYKININQKEKEKKYTKESDIKNSKFLNENILKKEHILTNDQKAKQNLINKENAFKSFINDIYIILGFKPDEKNLTIRNSFMKKTDKISIKQWIELERKADISIKELIDAYFKYYNLKQIELAEYANYLIEIHKLNIINLKEKKLTKFKDIHKKIQRLRKVYNSIIFKLTRYIKDRNNKKYIENELLNRFEYYLKRKFNTSIKTNY